MLKKLPWRNRTRNLKRITPASTGRTKQSYYDAQAGHIKLDRCNALHCNNAHNELMNGPASVTGSQSTSARNMHRQGLKTQMNFQVVS